MFKNIFKRKKNEVKQKSAIDDFWYGIYASLSAAGVPVTPENALKVSAIWACNKVISETIAMLPLLVYENLGEGAKERAREHYLYDILKTKPNNIQTSFDWRITLQSHLNLYGRAYSPIRRNFVGDITSYGLPIHPTRVRNILLENETLIYEVSSIEGNKVNYTQEEMLYLRGLTVNGYDGISPIEAGNNSIGLAIAAEIFGSKFFQKGARPNAAVIHKDELSQPAKSRLARSVQEMSETGVLVLEDEMKYQQMSSTPEESQFLQTRQHQVEEIARWYRIPLHKIQHLLRSTFNNIEHQDIEFYRDTMMPHIVNWEQRLNETIIDRGSYFVEFLTQAVLRGDMKTRTEFYKALFNMGMLSPNEGRILENMNPYEGGDGYYMQINMGRIDSEGNIAQSNSSENNNVDNNLNTAVAKDIAIRLANAETRGLEKTNDEKAFYVKHHEYIAKAIKPFNLDIQPIELTSQMLDKDNLTMAIYERIIKELDND